MDILAHKIAITESILKLIKRLLVGKIILQLCKVITVVRKVILKVCGIFLKIDWHCGKVINKCERYLITKR